MFQRMQRWETLEGSHCTSYNVEGAVYEANQQVMRASDLIVVQLYTYIRRVTHKKGVG